jgi:hypothetical protein
MNNENIRATFGVSPISNREAIELCITSGLFSVDGEEYFSSQGCQYCNPSLPGTVSDCDGFVSLADARMGNLRQFRICGECLNSLYYGEVKA